MLRVFLESGEQGSLPVSHPFYHLVEEALSNVVQSSIVTLYMARNTLKHEQFLDQLSEEQRVNQIVEYLKYFCPIISGSNSPAVESTFVEMRAYSGCSGPLADPKKRKITRKYVYISGRLANAWMKAFPTESESNVDHGKFLLLTFFIKLCLLRGLATAVNLEFALGTGSGKDYTRDALPATCASPCSFEYFLSQWSSAWLAFDEQLSSYDTLPYNKLDAIVITSRTSGFHHVEIKGTLRPQDVYYRCSDPRWSDSTHLRRLASGDWTAFPPLSNTPYNVFNSCCLQIWDSPPMEDSITRDIERVVVIRIAPQARPEPLLVQYANMHPKSFRTRIGM